MSLYLSPMFYGIQDQVVAAPTLFALRVYFPTDDDTVLGAPLLNGPHPLVVFAHGQRNSLTLPDMCPPEYTRDHQRWGLSALRGVDGHKWRQDLSGALR